MTIYLACIDIVTLMEGHHEQVLGVFDSEERAWDHLKTTDDFDKSVPTGYDSNRIYHFDGELSYHWYVKSTDINVPIAW